MNLQEYAEKRFSEDKEIVRIEVCGSKFGQVGRFIDKNGEYAQECINGVASTLFGIVKFERPEIKSYSCVTAVSTDGDILFNGQRQCLSIRNGVYNIHRNFHDDFKNQFIWIPCKREDLKSGDTAWACSGDFKPSNLGSACKILNDKDYVYATNGNNIIVEHSKFSNWYKLVRR